MKRVDEVFMLRKKDSGKSLHKGLSPNFAFNVKQISELVNFYFLLKSSEYQRFSDDFRGNRS